MRRIALGVLGLALAVALWEGAARAGWVNPALLIPPSEFVPAWWGTVRSGELPTHVQWTYIRILAGFAIGSLFGVALGIACHVISPLRSLTAPLVEIVRAVPPLALLPVFLLFFGIGLRFPVAVVVWSAWVPVFLNTLDGLDTVDESIREAACLDGAGPVRAVWYVALPVAAPQVLVGLRLAMGAGFLAIVAAEMMGATSGVGYYILDASATFRIPEMYGAIMTLGLMAFLANAVLVRTTWLLWPHTRPTESSPSSSPAARSRRRALAPESAPGMSLRSQPSRPSP